MKVLHVLHTSLPHVCGYSIRSDRILDHQLKAGLEVLAVTSAQQPGNAPDAPDSAIPHFRTRASASAHAPLRELQLMWALGRRVRDVIRAHRPDIVHAHSPVLIGLPAIAACRQLGVPFVYEVRDLWENASVDRGKFGYDSAYYRVARGLETWLMKRADAVFTIGETLRDALSARAARPITVIPNGADPSLFEPTSPPPHWKAQWNPGGGPLVAYIGSFQPYEGLEVLVRATERMGRRRRDVGVIVVGDGPERAALQALAGDLKLSDRLRFTGHVPHDRVREIYAVADLLVYPRLATATTRLTTPLKPLEALLMEKPVLASDLPPMRELIDDGVTGSFCRPGDADDLAERALALLADPARCRSLGRQGRAAALATRSWDRIVTGYLPEYQRVLRAGRHRAQ